MIYVVTGLIFTMIGVGNLVTGRLHPERPNARLSRGLGFVGIFVGTAMFIFGLLTATGLVVPPPMPGPPPAAAAPGNASVPAVPPATP